MELKSVPELGLGTPHWCIKLAKPLDHVLPPRTSSEASQLHRLGRALVDMILPHGFGLGPRQDNGRARCCTACRGRRGRGRARWR
eukprot:6663766-Lingulodinium_polyedra.AAC.1